MHKDEGKQANGMKTPNQQNITKLLIRFISVAKPLTLQRGYLNHRLGVLEPLCTNFQPTTTLILIEFQKKDKPRLFDLDSSFSI